MYGMAGGGLTSEFTSAGSMPYIVVSSQSPSHSNILIPRAAHAKERRPLRTRTLSSPLLLMALPLVEVAPVWMPLGETKRM